MSKIARMMLIVVAAFAFAGATACGGGGAATLVSIAVAPAAPSIATGATQQFAATATYSDGKTADVTLTVVWASSDTAVAAFETPDTDIGLATALAAGTATITATDADSAVSGAAELTVAALSGTAKALYETNGLNWNDYIANDGADIFKATDTACNPATAGPGYNACINGGIVRMVEVTGREVCEGLTATDSLGALRWVCDDTTNDVRMVSVGFADGKGLSDLIDFDAGAWKDMNVTVYRGGNPYLATDMAKLWGNTIVVNNAGVAMNNAGEIHLVTENPNAPYTIGADKVALIVKPGVAMQGEQLGGSVVQSTGKNFLWFEGAIDATLENYGIYASGVLFSVIQHTLIGNSNGSGVMFEGASKNNVIRSSNFYACGDNGISLEGASTDNWIADIVAVSNGIGILIDASSSRNTLLNLTLTNNDYEGLVIKGTGKDNISINVTAANNSDNGIYVHNEASNNVLMNATAVNSSTYAGIYFGTNCNDITLMNAVAANQVSAGIWLANNSRTTILNAASAHSGNDGYRLNTSSSNYFSGLIMAGANLPLQDCKVTAGTDPGLVDVTCMPQGASDFGGPELGISLANSFVGKVDSDAVNADGATGTKAYNDITDWVNFENPFRGWGRDGSDFPNNDNRGPCTAGTCRIWDWSLRSTDTVLRGAIESLIGLPTGDDTLTHTWSDASTVTFLRNAVEIMGDGIGNDNGLCESGETCLFTPNLGAYQGHGSLVPAGDFVDGAITGVTLMRYETNGR